MLCDKCGHQYPDDLRWCPFCGTPNGGEADPAHRAVRPLGLLHVLAQGQSEQYFFITEPGIPIDIGRIPENTIPINRLTLARRHVRLWPMPVPAGGAGGPYRLRLFDLTSGRNPVLLNGRDVGIEATISHGDTIRVGDAEIRVSWFA